MPQRRKIKRCKSVCVCVCVCVREREREREREGGNVTHINGSFSVFPDFFVQAFKIVVDS